MLRSLIQIGTTSLISLPRKWIKESGLKKGDKIEISISDTNIIIRPYRTGTVIFIGKDCQIPYDVNCELLSDLLDDGTYKLKWRGITFWTKKENVIRDN